MSGNVPNIFQYMLTSSSSQPWITIIDSCPSNPQNYIQVNYTFPSTIIHSGTSQLINYSIIHDIILAINLSLPINHCLNYTLFIQTDITANEDTARTISGIYLSPKPWESVNARLPNIVITIIDKQLPENPLLLLEEHSWSVDSINDTISMLEDYLTGKVSDGINRKDSMFILKQERADFVYNQFLFVRSNHTCPLQFISDHMDDYLEFMNKCVKRSVDYELKHARSMFQIESLMIRHELDLARRYKSQSGVRFGLSSANASDNYTFSMVEGGHVLSGPIYLADDKGQFGPTVSVVVDFPLENCSGYSHGILLESEDNIEPKGLKTVHFNPDDLKEFFSYTENQADHFRLLKHALVFTGIVSTQSKCHRLDYLFPDRLLRVRVVNRGPSRSGFASSSAVSLNLLRALFELTGQHFDNEQLCSKTWLFENEMGLKSGRQDIDALVLSGLNYIKYSKDTPLFPFYEPIVSPSSSLGLNIGQHIVLVDSGIPRSSHLDIRRGLNMRHLSYMTRDRDAYKAMKQSIGLHKIIVKSVQEANWKELGSCLLEYMKLREIIDPTALSSQYDHICGVKVLKKIFDLLIEYKAIYGGMLSGAMGGGVMILIVREGEDIDDHLETAKTSIVSPDGQIFPFTNLKRIHYKLS